MIKYKIVIELIFSTNNGKRFSKKHQLEFFETDPFRSRQKAIKETRRLTQQANEIILNHGIVEDEQVFFLINLIFIPWNGIEYKIFGEESEMFPSLAREAKFLNKIKETETLSVTCSNGNVYDILESDIEFFTC